MIPAHTSSENLTPVDDPAQLEMILDAIAEIDYDELTKKSTGDQIDELSSNTIFESIEVTPEAIFKRDNDQFEASAVVYVTLNYGGRKDGVSMPDSYPATVRGELTKDGAIVTDISVDTSSFYE